MKRLINILIVLIIPICGFATGQAGDRLIWNGDTLTVFSNPLELRNDIDSLRSKLFGEKEAGINTACWRGYIAEWAIIGNKILDRKSTRLNSSHVRISYAVFCLKKK